MKKVILSILFVVCFIMPIQHQIPQMKEGGGLEYSKIEKPKPIEQKPKMDLLSVAINSKKEIKVPPKEAEEPKKPINRGGSGIIKTMKVQATAYCDSGTTASGKPTKKNHTVASDWKYIPKGTKFWITEMGEDIIFEVEDKGGAVKKHIIDIYNPSYQWCINWGRRNVTINIIRWGNEE